MRKFTTIAATFIFAVLLISGVSISASNDNEQFNFTAHATGDQEVPARETRAQGQGIFRLSRDGTHLYYKVNVANIDNVVAAHIHLAPVGVNGPIIVGLFGGVAPGGGPTNGTLAEGTIPSSAPNFNQLIAAMRAGGTYLNVHTNDGVAPTNTGPGDFPGGEIRGQIK